MATGKCPNFITKVLYRIDFTDLTNYEFDKVITQIKSQYYHYFSDIKSEQEVTKDSNIDLLNDRISSTTNRYNVRIFLGEHNGAKLLLKLSKSFVYLEVTPTKEDYTQVFFELFKNIMTTIKSTVKYMFNINRVGLRKFNTLFYRREEMLNQISNLFNCKLLSFGGYPDSVIEKYQSQEVYNSEGFKVVFSKNSDVGKYKDFDAGRIAFDFDIFVTNKEMSNLTNTNIKDLLDEMNTKVREYYFLLFNEGIREKIQNGESRLEDYGIIRQR